MIAPLRTAASGMITSTKSTYTVDCTSTERGAVGGKRTAVIICDLERLGDSRQLAAGHRTPCT
jgi:hypothetical protein